MPACYCLPATACLLLPACYCLSQALADLVEALVGAVYLDSSGHLGAAEAAVAALLQLQQQPVQVVQAVGH